MFVCFLFFKSRFQSHTTADPRHSEVDWTGYLRTPWKSWPVYDAFVTHLRVVGLSSDPQQNTVVRKLHIRAEPFAEGAMRYAFPATTEDGKRFVLKARIIGVWLCDLPDKNKLFIG